MAKTLDKRIRDIRRGKQVPESAQETNLAERWEQLGSHQMHLEELKVRSETFQINRGGRIIPRYASVESRENTPEGRRAEPEITHALQILDRYLRDECTMSTNRRMECLGDIMRAALGLQDAPEFVTERVRVRLYEAQKKTPLNDLDYRDAIGVTQQANDDRQVTFLKCMAILESGQGSPEEQQQAEATLEALFSFQQFRESSASATEAQPSIQ